MEKAKLVAVTLMTFLLVGGMPLASFGQTVIEKDVPDFMFGYGSPEIDWVYDAISYDLWLHSADDGDSVLIASGLADLSDSLYLYPFSIDTLAVDDPHEVYWGRTYTRIIYDGGEALLVLTCDTEERIRWRRAAQSGCCWLQ